MKNQKGMSLMEMLVSIAIMAIAMAGVVTLQMHQQKETRAISEKLALLDFEKLLMTSMMDGSTCKFVLNDPTPLTFNSTALNPSAPQYLTPSRPLYAKVNGGTPGAVIAQLNQPLTPDNTSLVPRTIRLKIESGNGSTYVGRWEVHFDSARLVRALKPVTASAVLTVDNSTPTAARVVDCIGSGVSQFVNVTYHSFCATPPGGTVLKPAQPNRMCALSATDDDVGPMALASDYKCRVEGNAASWMGFAPLGCGQVACIAVCFDVQ
ncbi:type II secretion system protein [Bdellovibrio bacteriovorus]|uniref:type II secretion system protein n=1 Tax=Bdellovibrio bacteriovorus TaxID=959 RepID=UPI0035A87E1C